MSREFLDCLKRERDIRVPPPKWRYFYIFIFLVIADIHACFLCSKWAFTLQKNNGSVNGDFMASKFRAENYHNSFPVRFNCDFV